MRLLAKLFTSLLIVLVIALCTFITVLHTSYGLPMVQRIVATFTPYQLYANALEYDIFSPFTLSFHKPALFRIEQLTAANHISLTLSPLMVLQGKWALQNVIIRGVSFNEAKPSWIPTSLTVHQLALDDLTFTSDDLTFFNADIQLSEWQNSDDGWGHWGGLLQLSIPKLQWQGQTLTNVLLNSESSDSDSGLNHQQQRTKIWEVWGLSFDSAFGDVTASARRRSDNQWDIDQLTISEARIELLGDISGLQEYWSTFIQAYRIDIRRLDLLDISVELPSVSIEHLNLSAQSLRIQNGKLYWTEPDQPSLFSFNANMLRYDHWVLTDTLAELSLTQRHIDINAFSSTINDEGFLSFSGSFDKKAIKLNSLLINNVELNVTTPMMIWLEEKWTTFDQVAVKQLSVKRINITQPNSSFPVQLIDLNLRGSNLVLKKEGASGMWAGSVTASAATASLNRISLSTPYVAMSVNGDNWKLDSLNLSFPQGQLTAIATMGLTNPSRPWTFQAEGLHIPSELYQRWFMANLPFSGEHDVIADFTGLAADKDSFAYSFSGFLNAIPHRTVLSNENGQPLTKDLFSLLGSHYNSNEEITAIPLQIGEVKLTADRGRVIFSPVRINVGIKNTFLSGHWDLVTQEGELTNTSH